MFHRAPHLIRHGMNRLPANQTRKPHGRAWKRYEKPQPGHLLQLDVKFLERIAGTRERLYQFTAISAEFQSRFHWHLEEQDFRHVYIRPRTPHLNGKVERSHRVDEQEFYQLLDKDGIADNTNGCWQKLMPACHRRLETVQHISRIVSHH